MSYFRHLFSPGNKLRFWPILIIFVMGFAIGGISAYILAPNILPAKQPTAESAPPKTDTDLPEDSIPGNPVVNVASRVGPSIVGISSQETRSNFLKTETVELTGSGVIINDQGYIITNNHVVGDNPEVTIALSDGRQTMGRVVGADARTDLALVKINLTNLAPAKLGDSEKVRVGELAIAIGNPLGIRFARSVTSGVISGVNRLLTNEEGLQFQLLQTDAAINPGNSGGPLINSSGEIIGINTIKISQPGFEGMGFAIPSNTVKTVANQLIKYKRVIRPRLGVQIVQDIDRMLATDFALPVTSGVLIKVIPKGSAARAGLTNGDIIVGVNGKTVRNGAELQSRVDGFKAGDTVSVTVQRETGVNRWRKQNFRVRLTEMS